MDKRGMKVGDYLYCSWGYDQTNIDFYKVVSLVGKTMVEIVPVASKVVDSKTAADYVVPTDVVRDYDVLLGMNRGEVGTARKKAKDGRVTIQSGYYWARVWDGTPKYETASGYGH